MTDLILEERSVHDSGITVGELAYIAAKEDGLASFDELERIELRTEAESSN